MENGADGLIPRVRESRLVIGLDYGTTFTGVAFATPIGNECSLEDIVVLSDWGPQMINEPKVPSVISYSPRTQAEEQQWGSSLSPNAVTMVHTKLELDVDKVEDELELILASLDGTRNLGFAKLKECEDGGTPEYTHYSAEEIVTDYLTHVFKYLDGAVDYLSQELRDIIPTDIVVTIPTKWSYRAMNSTYRALTQAGFNRTYFPKLKEVIFVTESEAAAIYTARYLKTVEGTEFLKVNEPFILCDGGGGTVDVVSYKVTKLQPMLQIEKIGEPTGRKCGSVFINLAFKQWLRALIGDDNYQQLDPELEGTRISSHAVEGKAMRQLMKDFEARKVIFHSNYGQDIYLELPAPLDDLNIPERVNDGVIIIKSEKMEEFFDGCVDGITDLIRGHLRKIKRPDRPERGTGVRLKNVFLVGGFGESQYLQEQLEKHLRLEKITLRRPDTSWTAVVQGAVVCGIEKSDTDKLVRAGSCKHHYGIVSKQLFSAAYNSRQDRVKDKTTGLVFAEGQLLWFLSKGDLVPSTKPLTVTKVISLNFGVNDTKKKIIHFYRYSEDDERPTRFHDARNELIEVYKLEVDLAGPEFRNAFEIIRRNPDVIRLEVKVIMKLAGDNLSASVWWERKELARAANIAYA